MNQYRTATIPIFTIGEMKRMAKKQLKGKWLRLLPPMLIYTILTTVPAAVIQIYSYLTQSAQIDKILESGNSATSTTDMISDVLISSQASQTGSLTILGTIASFLTLYLFLVSGPFSISFAELSLRVLRNESFSASTVFSGFHQFVRTCPIVQKSEKYDCRSIQHSCHKSAVASADEACRCLFVSNHVCPFSLPLYSSGFCSFCRLVLCVEHN